jgi:iron complex outermembrane receptor protein
MRFRNSFRSMLLATAGLMISAPAMAQQAGAGPVAHSASDDASGLGDVVVTARKIRENLQKTPIAISAYSGEDLRNQSVQSLAELSNQTPGLFMTTGSTGDPHTPLVAIRGQTQNTTALSVDASIGMYQDGVYSTGTIGASINHFLDIDRVEILKGPQGTLYGRNTTGGAINIYTKTPVLDSLSGEATLGGGNYGEHDESGVLNLPLVKDKAALRVAVGQYDHDGYGRDLLNDRAVGDDHTTAARATLLLKPQDQLTIQLRGSYEIDTDGGLIAKPIYMQPGGPANASAAKQLYGAVNPTTETEALNVFNQRAHGGNFYDIYSTPNNLNFGRLSVESGSATIGYDLGGLTLKSITAYNKVDTERNLDGLAVGVEILGNYQHTYYSEWTQELQATGSALDEKLKYALGAYYFYLDGVDRSAASVFGGPASPIAAKVDESSPAIYGQASYAVLDNLHITGGLRQTWETKDVDAFLLGIDGKTDNQNLSYTAGADWEATPQLMVYAKTSRGYKSGGFNQRMTTNPLTQVAYQPEVATDYEVGVKSQWLENRLRVNADVYHTDYQDIQRSAISNSTGGGSPTTVTKNVGNGKIDGFEAEATAVPTRAIWLHATVGYTDPRYLTYTDSGFNQNFQNFGLVSRWTYSASGAYIIPTPAGDLRAQLDWVWRSAYDTDPSDAPGTVRVVGGVPVNNNPGVPDIYRIQQAYGLLNAQLSLKVARYDMDVRLWGKNLLGQQYITQEVSFVGAGLGFGYGAPGDPRTFGVEVTKRF